METRSEVTRLLGMNGEVSLHTGVEIFNSVGRVLVAGWVYCQFLNLKSAMEIVNPWFLLLCHQRPSYCKNYERWEELITWD